MEIRTFLFDRVSITGLSHIDQLTERAHQEIAVTIKLVEGPENSDAFASESNEY
jgi:hypothetical protein